MISLLMQKYIEDKRQCTPAVKVEKDIRRMIIVQWNICMLSMVYKMHAGNS